MNTHEKTIKVSMLVFSDVGSKQMPFSSFLPRAEGDLSPSTESCICCVITRAGIKVSLCAWLWVLIASLASSCCLLQAQKPSLASTCVRLCLRYRTEGTDSSGWQPHQGQAERILHANCRAKKGVQQVRNKTGSMSHASLACHSARCSWDMALCCIKQLCQVGLLWEIRLPLCRKFLLATRIVWGRS